MSIATTLFVRKMVTTSYQKNKKGTQMKASNNHQSLLNMKNMISGVILTSSILFGTVQAQAQVRGDLGRPGRGGGHSLQVADSRVIIEKSRALNLILRNKSQLLSARSVDQINQLLDEAIDLADDLGRDHNDDHLLPPRYDDGQIQLSAICHIDDDSQFDFNQRIAGEVRGSSVQGLLNECESLARVSGLRVFSTGIKEVKIIGSVRGLVTAECQLDDDPQFDNNQLVIGQIAGRSIEEVGLSCSKIADHIYHGRGSSGLVNVRRN